MITSRFPLGNVSFTDGYFSTLVGEATKQCYGVAAMAPRNMTDAVKSMVYGSDYPEKGVRVTQQNGRLVIELHIAVSYGLNISTAARSISHRVKDEVEQATGLKVARVVVRTAQHGRSSSLGSFAHGAAVVQSLQLTHGSAHGHAHVGAGVAIRHGENVQLVHAGTLVVDVVGAGNDGVAQDLTRNHCFYSLVSGRKIPARVCRQIRR